MIWLVLRVVVFVAVVAVIATAAGLLVDTSGEVAITWDGYTYPPLSLVEFVGVVLMTMLVLYALYKLAGLLAASIRFLLGDETALTRYWSRAKERRGFEALSSGMVAMAEGNHKAAAVYARKAARLLGAGPLTDLLQANIAEAQGDVSRAKQHYRALAKEPPTAMVGVKGLLKQAVARGETDRALKFAEHAFAIRPNDTGVQQTLFDLQVKQANWEGALKTLTALAKGKSLPRDVSERRRAVINLEIARHAAETGDEPRATAAADAAVKAAPGLAPAAVFSARRAIARGEGSRAAKLLKEAWKHAPQPDIAEAYAEIAPTESPSERRRRFRDFIAMNATHDEAKYLSAELAIADNDWRGARKALGDMASEKPNHRSLAMMAAIEKGEGSPEAIVRGYLARAVSAPRGAHWICDRCAASPGGWHAVCPSCGGFDTLAWRESGDEADLGGAMLPLMVDDAESKASEDQLDAAAAEEAVREAAEARR